MKEHPTPHHLHVYYIVIRSELKYLIGVIDLQVKPDKKLRVCAQFGFLMWWNPLQQFRFSSDPEPELNPAFGTVANTK